MTILVVTYETVAKVVLKIDAFAVIVDSGVVGTLVNFAVIVIEEATFVDIVVITVVDSEMLNAFNKVGQNLPTKIIKGKF